MVLPMTGVVAGGRTGTPEGRAAEPSGVPDPGSVVPAPPLDPVLVPMLVPPMLVPPMLVPVLVVPVLVVPVLVVPVRVEPELEGPD
jgi:hypothetical protein